MRAPTKMCFTNWTKYFAPALLIGALALFLLSSAVQAQKLQDLPLAPPPPRYKPKPTPTPTPLRDEDYDVVRVSSNLVMVPVSVVAARGEPTHAALVMDFHYDGQRRPSRI